MKIKRLLFLLSIFIFSSLNAYTQHDSIRKKIWRIDTLNVPDSIKQQYKNILREHHVYVKIERTIDTIEKRCEIHFKNQIILSYKKEQYIYGKDKPPKVQVGSYVTNNGKHRLKYPLEFQQLKKEKGVTIREYLSGCKAGTYPKPDSTSKSDAEFIYKNKSP